jgi:hypothetical protein
MSPKGWGKTGYFGHTPMKYYGRVGPILGPEIVLIDTGAFSGGGLTAICHETKEILTIQ